MEEWRTIPSAILYEASSHGRVRRAKSGRLLKLHINHDGYLRTELWCMAQRTNVRAHRVVCEAFNGPCPDGMDQVNHRNLDKADNRPENLEWCDGKANIHHYYRSRDVEWVPPERTHCEPVRRGVSRGIWV